MNPAQRTARIAAVLFLTALVADLVGGELIVRIIHAPDYLSSVYSNRIHVITGMLLELVAAAAVVGIPVMLFSTLKKHSERIALGYIGFQDRGGRNHHCLRFQPAVAVDLESGVCERRGDGRFVFPDSGWFTKGRELLGLSDDYVFLQSGCFVVL